MQCWNLLHALNSHVSIFVSVTGQIGKIWTHSWFHVSKVWQTYPTFRFIVKIILKCHGDVFFPPNET